MTQPDPCECGLDSCDECYERAERHRAERPEDFASLPSEYDE